MPERHSKAQDGFNLGTLCAFDIAPRQFSPEEKKILRDLAAMIADELELRLALRQRAQQTAAIDNLRSGVLAADPSQPDNPIVFSNPAFTEMTGYEYEEIVGRNCRFLQGPDTDQTVTSEIREAIAARRNFHGVLRNYRKDGMPFWNELTISPVCDNTGKLISVVGLQTDVTERLNLESPRFNSESAELRPLYARGSPGNKVSGETLRPAQARHVDALCRDFEKNALPN